MYHEKRNEWLELLAKCGGSLTPDAFFKNASRKDSAFHDDYTWDKVAALKEYYEKRTANLIMRYSTVFNTTTAEQRLHGVRPMLPSGVEAKKKVYRNPNLISESESELAQIRAAIWSRLSRVVRDMYDFKDYLPEFNEMMEYLLPKVQKLEETKAVQKNGAAAH